MWQLHRRGAGSGHAAIDREPADPPPGRPCARRLLARDTHRVALSAEGQAFLDHARRVLAAHGQMDAHLSGLRLRGRLRFGACEDFVLSALPDVLALFSRRHPDVDVALTVALSETLYDQFDAGGWTSCSSRSAPVSGAG
jgi:hypothetical protein